MFLKCTVVLNGRWICIFFHFCLGVESSGFLDVGESDPCGDFFFDVAVCRDEVAKILEVIHSLKYFPSHSTWYFLCCVSSVS